MEPTTEPEQVMVSSPHESMVALSSPPTPSFDSPPATPSSSLLTLSDSPDPYLQSRDPVYLASSLLRLLDERKEEFHCSFGQVTDSLERLKRDNNKREGEIKNKRDNIVMMENLIKMKEKEVKNLETAVEANGGQRLPSAPTSLSLRPFFTLSATSNASSSVSGRKVPTSTVSNVLPSVQSDERKVSEARGLPMKKIARVGKEVLIADAPGKKTAKDDTDAPGKKTAKDYKEISGPGGLTVKKVAQRKDSGAGGFPVRKNPKVVASEPRKRLPVSTPFKGRVGLSKTFKGKLHDAVIVKRPSSSSPALLKRRTTPLKTENCSD